MRVVRFFTVNFATGVVFSTQSHSVMRSNWLDDVELTVGQTLSLCGPSA